MDLTEAEDSKKRWQEYTELYKKDLHGGNRLRGLKRFAGGHGSVCGGPPSHRIASHSQRQPTSRTPCLPRFPRSPRTLRHSSRLGLHERAETPPRSCPPGALAPDWVPPYTTFSQGPRSVSTPWSTSWLSTEAEDIKKRWQEYTENCTKKIFMTQIITMV